MKLTKSYKECPSIALEEDTLDHIADASKKVERDANTSKTIDSNYVESAIIKISKEQYNDALLKLKYLKKKVSKTTETLLSEEERIKCLIERLYEAEKVLKEIAVNLTTDPRDMQVAIPDWCCDQECLNLINKYFEA